MALARATVPAMRLRLPSAAILCLASLASASEFRDRSAQLAAVADNDAAIEAWFAERRAVDQASDPEYDVVVANHWFAKARRGVEISRRPAAAGDLVLSDPQTGEAVGSIGAGEPDPELVRLAVEALRDGVERFPDRLDIRFGLAHLHHELGEADLQYATLAAAAERAAAHPADQRWRDGGELPAPAERFVPETLQACAHAWFELETPAGDERFLAIAELAIARFPKHPYAYNSVAAYWYAKKDPAKALQFLRTAHELDPADQLIVLNLGSLALEAGDQAQGRACLEAVLASDADDAVKDAAKEKLAGIAP